MGTDKSISDLTDGVLRGPLRSQFGLMNAIASQQSLVMKEVLGQSDISAIMGKNLESSAMVDSAISAVHE